MSQKFHHGGRTYGTRGDYFRSAALPVTLMIGRRRSAHATVADAQAEYCRLRDDSGEGASTFPEGKVWEPCGPRLRISYNGRAWLGSELVYEAPACAC